MKNIILPQIPIVANSNDKNSNIDNNKDKTSNNKIDYNQKAKDNFYKILNYFDSTNETAEFPPNYMINSQKGYLTKHNFKFQLVDPNKIINDIKLKYDYKEKIKKLTMENINYSTTQNDQINSVTTKAKFFKKDDDNIFNTKLIVNEYIY